MRFAPLSLCLLFLGLVALLGACNVDVTSGETFICADEDVGAANRCAPGFECRRHIFTAQRHCLPEGTQRCDEYVCDDMTMDMPTDVPVCGDTVCGEDCVNIDINAMHCGACNNACRPGMACRNGACWCGASGECPTGQDCCGDLCVPADDPTCECGGAFCGAGQRCCGDDCVTAVGDMCGVCPSCPGVACERNGVCNCDVMDCETGPNVMGSSCSESGGCMLACDDGYGDCDANPANGCEGDIGSAEHCGGCGNVCDATTTGCADGNCDGIRSLVAGAQATCALTDFDYLVCWGLLGTVAMDRWEQPTRIDEDVKAVSFFGNTLCYLTNDNRIECRSPNTPELVTTARTWTNMTVILDDIVVGEGFFCVAGGQGPNRRLYCGGADTSPLGEPNPTGNMIHLVNLPDPPAAGDDTLAAGQNHVCVIDQAGDLVCWGNNSTRQVADTSNIWIADPTVVGPPASAMGSFDMQKVAAGTDFTCAKTSADRTWCWGNNNVLQVTDTAGPEIGEPTLRFVDASCTVVAMDAGYDHICQLCEDGRIKCWGANDFGKSSADTGGANPFPPDFLLQFSDNTFPALLMATGQKHNCIDGGVGIGVQCWGTGSQFQLGPGVVSTATPTSADTRPQLP